MDQRNVESGGAMDATGWQLRLIVAASLVLALSSEARAATVRVSYYGAPVPGVTVEVLDARSGVVVATARSGDDGRVEFPSLPQLGLFEAQTPNGEFVSRRFDHSGHGDLVVDGGRDAIRGLFRTESDN